jgi:hypothetical protein
MFGFMQSPDCRRYAPLSGEAKYPAGARPMNVLLFVIIYYIDGVPVSRSSIVELIFRLRGEGPDPPDHHPAHEPENF